jgi:ribosomal protein L2
MPAFALFGAASNSNHETCAYVAASRCSYSGTKPNVLSKVMYVLTLDGGGGDAVIGWSRKSTPKGIHGSRHSLLTYLTVVAYH